MKKEKLFHLLPLMMVAALTFGFAACGDDDDDEGGQRLWQHAHHFKLRPVEQIER